MPTWNYEARDSSGKIVSGAHEAADRPQALEFLRAQGLFLTRLEAGRAVSRSGGAQVVAPATPKVNPPQNRVPDARNTPVSVVTEGRADLQTPRLATAPLVPQPLLRASSKDLSVYFRQMGALVHAGTTLGAALHSMTENAPNAALRTASQQMQVRVMSGEPFSSSMSAFPGLFSPLQIGMMSAGERGGFLPEMFARLSKYCERDYDLQQTVKRETWYPKLLIFASILIPSAIPLVLAVVQKTGNPFLAWLSQVWLPFGVIALCVFGYRAINYAAPLAAHYSKPKLLLDRFKLVVPIGGKVVRGLATAKFCRALGALYSAGVGPGESVRLASAACGNAAIAEGANSIIPRLEHGETLTSCLNSTGYFNRSVMQVMAVGEESGNLDGQLDKAADFLEADAEVAVKQSVQVFSMLIFLCIAVYIGLQVGRFWLGYFNDAFTAGEQMTN